MIIITKKLSILLVEDDKNACKDIVEYADEMEDVSIVGVTNNADKAVEYVTDYQPHAIILDLELHEGFGNGLTFLGELKNLKLEVTPYILVTTNNSSAVTYEYARKLGADFIMSKHQSDYSAQSVVEFLRMMKDILISKAISANPNHMTTETPEQKTKRITRRICTELDLIGISPKAVGYQYLIDAIQIVLKQPTNNICSIIGAMHSKSDSSVERAIQNALNRAWRTSDIEDLLKYYTAKISSDKGVPTMTEFIYYYANKIKNEY